MSRVDVFSRNGESHKRAPLAGPRRLKSYLSLQGMDLSLRAWHATPKVMKAPLSLC